MISHILSENTVRYWITSHRMHASIGALIAIVALGLVPRLFPALSADFPLNDGGFFYLMTREIQRAHYALPVYTSYNSAQIPFAYPPLAFYLAGFISDITRWPLLDVIRLLPAIASVLTIPAFFLFSRTILRSWTQSIFAVFAFAMLPRTFVWFIMGGGLTRAPGLLFAILMLHQAHLLYTRRETRFVLSTILFAVATVLTHAETTWFAVYSAVLLFLFYGRDRKGVVNSLVVVVGVLALTAPWWATVMSRHGLSPFLSAAGSGTQDRYALPLLKTFSFTDEPYLPLFAVFGLLGIFVRLAERKFFLPVWLLAIFFINPRNPDTPAMLPLAMLVGVAMDRLILPGILRVGAANHVQVGEGKPAADRNKPGRMHRVSRMLPLVVPVVMLGYLLGYAFKSAWTVASASSALKVLPREERDAMRWVSGNTPETSTFLVLRSSNWFGEDPTSEWFPALAQRVSLATVQGYEWLPNLQFHGRQKPFNALQACAGHDASCLARWMAQTGIAASHVYLSTGCCKPLEQSLRSSPDYALVYDGKGATIFARSTGGQRSSPSVTKHSGGD
jgi:hypothetical protein